MSSDSLDLIRQAVDAGNSKDAMRFAGRMHDDDFRIHEAYRDWITCLLTYIGKRLGDEGVYQALHESWQSAGKNREQDLRQQVARLASGLRGHITSLQIEEDDDTITLMMTPCGSGGRGVLSGLYCPPRNYLRIQDPQPMTFGKSDFPVYCAHCALVDIIPIEMSGYAKYVTIPPDADKIGKEPCRFVIYKDPDKIPPEHYERYGKSKPPVANRK